MTREEVELADLVVSAEATHRSFVLDGDPSAFRKVLTLGQLAQAVQAADAGLGRGELLEQIGERRGSAEGTLDIGDPFGRGSAKAEACAQQIDSYLRVVIPALVAAERN